MAARLITAGIGIVVCIGLMFLGEINPIVLTIAISLVTGLMCGELLTAKKLHKKLIISIPSVMLGILMPLLSSTDFVFIPLYLFTVAVFVSAVLYHEKITADDKKINGKTKNEIKIQPKKLDFCFIVVFLYFK